MCTALDSFPRKAARGQTELPGSIWALLGRREFIGGVGRCVEKVLAIPADVASFRQKDGTFDRLGVESSQNLCRCDFSSRKKTDLVRFCLLKWLA